MTRISENEKPRFGPSWHKTELIKHGGPSDRIFGKRDQLMIFSFMMVILFRCLTQYVMQMQNFIFASSLCTRVFFFFLEILLSHLKVHIFQEYIVKYIYITIFRRVALRRQIFHPCHRCRIDFIFYYGQFQGNSLSSCFEIFLRIL